MGRLGVEAGPMLLTEKLEGFWEIWRQKDRGTRVAECLQERMDGCWQLYTGFLEWETELESRRMVFGRTKMKIKVGVWRWEPAKQAGDPRCLWTWESGHATLALSPGVTAMMVLLPATMFHLLLAARSGPARLLGPPAYLPGLEELWSPWALLLLFMWLGLQVALYLLPARKVCALF